MHISSQFEGGSISVISAAHPQDIQLELVPDGHSEFRQWFYFRVCGAEGQTLALKILHVKDSAYPDGWPTYQARASYDRKTWFKVPTSFDGDSLTINFKPERESVFIAYFTPYSYERHLDWLSVAQQSRRCTASILGQSVEGRAMNMLTIGEPGPSKRNCWFIGRQHSGETMAEWFLEGLTARLLDETDSVAQTLLQKAVFYIVPNMNPDGSVHGHQRLNALGIDLNREWLEPSQDKSPEVFCVRQKMKETGVDFFLDAHGDENIPYNFLAARRTTDRIENLRERFKSAFLGATPEFQTVHGYTANPTTPINLNVAVNYVGQTFDCVSFTLEMPFNDNLLLPHPQHGWSGERSQKLGADCLIPLMSIIDCLR